MKRCELVAHPRKQKWAVACTSSALGAPESALVGVAFTPAFEIVFDTFRASRKVVNIQRDSGISFFIGGWSDGDEQTVQYEGVADFPQSEELGLVKASYFAVFPEGRKRESGPGTVYVRAKPTWIRYSNLNGPRAIVQEFALLCSARSGVFAVTAPNLITHEAAACRPTTQVGGNLGDKSYG